MATRIVIEFNRSRCDGFGKCINAAPDIFDLGDEGKVYPKQASVDMTRLEQVRRAAYDCPVMAIVLAEVE